MSNHRQGCKWHGELRHEVSSSVCGCDDQLMQHKPECPASWGVGDMPEGPCTFCEMLRACEQRVRQDERAAALYAAREAIAALDIGRDVRFSVDVRADALAAIDALREKP